MSEFNRRNSEKLSGRARETIPGGVSSYARKFEREINWKSGSGSVIQDIDGNTYVDYLQAWGAIIIGHCNSDVNNAVNRLTEKQDLYGYGTTKPEVKLAETVKKFVPSAERVFFGVTGSEVTAHAIRLARGATGRRKIVKFQGHYHGWYDSLAMNHMSDEENVGQRDPFTSGILDEVLEQTIVLPFNDIEAVEEAFNRYGDDIAGVILEPVAHNMGCIPPVEGFLEGLREITDEFGSLLIFDEIISGIRHSLGGVQSITGVTPDLTTMGKSVANGYPISILCGKSQYMEQFSPAGGSVAFGGTYNAHAGALAAALETIDQIQKKNFHEKAIAYRDTICNALEEIISDHGISATVAKYGSVWLTYFMEDPPVNYQEVLMQDEEMYREYRWKMIDQGIFMVPSNARRNYITASHTKDDAESTIEAAKTVLADLAE